MKAEEFGSFIRSIRKQNKLTIRYVEERCGVSNSYLSQLENGKRGIPSPGILEKLADGLDYPYEELMKAAGYLHRDNVPIDNMDNMSENSTHKGEDSDIEIDPEWQELYEQVKEKGAKLEATVLLRAVADGRMTKDKLEALLLALDFIDKKG